MHFLRSCILYCIEPSYSFRPEFSPHQLLFISPVFYPLYYPLNTLCLGHKREFASPNILFFSSYLVVSGHCHGNVTHVNQSISCSVKSRLLSLAAFVCSSPWSHPQYKASIMISELSAVSAGNSVFRNALRPFGNRPSAQKLFDVHCVDGRVAAVLDALNYRNPHEILGAQVVEDENLVADLQVIDVKGRGILLPSFVVFCSWYYDIETCQCVSRTWIGYAMRIFIWISVSCSITATN